MQCATVEYILMIRIRFIVVQNLKIKPVHHGRKLPFAQAEPINNFSAVNFILFTFQCRKIYIFLIKFYD